MRRAQTCFRRAGRVEWEALAHNNLAHLLKEGGRLRAASAAVTAGIRLARETSNLWALGYLRSTEAEIALAEGNVAGARRSLGLMAHIAR